MTAKKIKSEKTRERFAPSSPDAPIHCIYFYYIKVITGGSELRVYYRFDKRNPVTNIVNEITKLTINAFEDENNPPCIGNEVSDVDWRRKSYIVVMVEDYRLNRPPFGMQSELGKENRFTFGRVTSVTVPVTDNNGNSKNIMGGYLINTMKHYVYGDDLLEEDAGELFKIILNPPILEFYPDSGGTNMGPPIGPP